MFRRLISSAVASTSLRGGGLSNPSGMASSWLPTSATLGGFRGDGLGPKPLVAPAQIATIEQTRSVIKYSHYRGGAREPDEDALARFYRLNCGLWIHAMPGRNRRIWRKTPDQREKLAKHVFCRKHYCRMMDKMVTERWKKPKYLPDSIYEPYHNFVPPGHVYKTWK